MRKVVILVHRLGPYHYARLTSLSKLCDLKVIQTVSVDTTYKWAEVKGDEVFPVFTLFESEKEMAASSDVYLHVSQALEACHPEVVMIPGWSRDVAILAFKWCLANKCSTVLMSESTKIDFKRQWIKEKIKNVIVRHFDAAFVGGSEHKKYLCHLGMVKNKIFLGYDAVDNRYFQESARKVRESKQHLINGVIFKLPFFLVSNRFIEKKNLKRLVIAYKQYRDNCHGKMWDMVILGDGELLPQVKSKINDLGLSGCVVLPGFKQYEELPEFYGTASCFILASTSEQWGLVVNEAMASGLPVLVSERCGSASELVVNGVNGFKFNPYDIDQMAKCMIKVSEDMQISMRFGQRSQEIIADWGVEKFARNSIAACHCALEQNRPKDLPFICSPSKTYSRGLNEKTVTQDPKEIELVFPLACISLPFCFGLYQCSDYYQSSIESYTIRR